MSARHHNVVPVVPRNTDPKKMLTKQEILAFLSPLTLTTCRLGSWPNEDTRVRTHYSHQMTAAARAIAAMKFLMLRSKRVAIRRQSLRRQNMRSMMLRCL